LTFFLGLRIKGFSQSEVITISEEIKHYRIKWRENKKERDIFFLSCFVFFYMLKKKPLNLRQFETRNVALGYIKRKLISKKIKEKVKLVYFMSRNQHISQPKKLDNCDH
jgi:hypothetical protein